MILQNHHHIQHKNLLTIYNNPIRINIATTRLFYHQKAKIPKICQSSIKVDRYRKMKY